MYANSQSNGGFVYGVSNTTLDSPVFVMGQVLPNSNIAYPDMVIANHQIGVGGNSNPAFTFDVTGDVNYTGNLYHNGNIMNFDQSCWTHANGTQIYSTANVGIGTTNPVRPLHVWTGGTGVTQVYGEAAVLNGSLAVMHGVNDAYRFISALDNSMVAGDKRYYTLGKTLGLNNQGEISYNHVGDGNSSNYLGLGLYGGTYFSVCGNGNVGIGTTSPVSTLTVSGGATVGAAFSNISTPDANTLLVSGNIGVGTSTPQASIHTTGTVLVGGTITAYGDIVSFQNVSDVSLKTNFTFITNATCNLNRLTPVEFDWQSNIFNTQKAGTRDVGLVAQQVQQVLPLVTGEVTCPNNVTYKTISYDKLVPYLIQSIQELSARITILESDQGSPAVAAAHAAAIASKMTTDAAAATEATTAAAALAAEQVAALAASDAQLTAAAASKMTTDAAAATEATTAAAALAAEQVAALAASDAEITAALAASSAETTAAKAAFDAVRAAAGYFS